MGVLTNRAEKFIDHYKDENVETKYSAGTVSKRGGAFLVTFNQIGAEESFSIGQPVYDKENDIMGYLGIGLFEHLDYSTDGQIRIPVEAWMICLPTKHCKEGKKIYTYWQMKENSQESEDE